MFCCVWLVSWIHYPDLLLSYCNAYSGTFLSASHCVFIKSCHFWNATPPSICGLSKLHILLSVWVIALWKRGAGFKRHSRADCCETSQASPLSPWQSLQDRHTWTWAVTLRISYRLRWQCWNLSSQQGYLLRVGGAEQAVSKWGGAAKYSCQQCMGSLGGHSSPLSGLPLELLLS